jgi:hypothetical protein
MLQGEILAPVEHLHRRFDAAYDQMELLSEQIDQHRAAGLDCRLLLAQLRDAEAEKKAAFAELRKARWLKVVPAA